MIAISDYADFFVKHSSLFCRKNREKSFIKCAPQGFDQSLDDEDLVKKLYKNFLCLRWHNKLS
jgi:hypothetical protein